MWFQERRTVSFQVIFLNNFSGSFPCRVKPEPLRALGWMVSGLRPAHPGSQHSASGPRPRSCPLFSSAVWLPRMPLPNFIWHILPQDQTQGRLLCETSPDLPIRISGNILCSQSRRHSPISWITCVTVCVYRSLCANLLIASSACVPGHMCTQGAA